MADERASAPQAASDGGPAMEPEPVTRDPGWLREDLMKEYFTLVDVVGAFDARVMTVKGWSVTLSLVALGLGFQQGHYALFALAAATALGFWLIEGQMKVHQWRYYSRMRDIELALYHLNRVHLPQLGEMSAPRIDQQWGYRGGLPDWRTDRPWRRTPEEVGEFIHKPFRAGHVLLPHAVAVLLGAVLFIGALSGWPGLAQLTP